ncbi:redoxin domain-containing protein [Pedobacter sp. B4-66]|uniref:redoxin domain-containing protein n=1 Tax=Pedobacter sp. B4-66 TaxID=2817280 RepID=UPI001BDA8965|nr:redoxin domain-containing protein [Pedobacter sp. B4-66]
MYRLLTFLFVFATPFFAPCQELNVPKGQQFAYTWHVVGKGTHKTDKLHTYVFRSLGRNDKGEHLFECRLVRAVEKNYLGASPDLDTDNPKATVFNNSGVLTPLALLQQTLIVTFSAKGKLLDIAGYDNVLLRVDRDWALQKGIRGQIESHKEWLTTNIQDMFFQFPDEPIGSSGEWKDKGQVSYKMEKLFRHPRGTVKINKEVPEPNKLQSANEPLLQVSFVGEGNTKEKGIYVLDPKTGLVTNLSKNRSFDFTYSSVSGRHDTDYVVEIETNPKESNLDTAWINMAVKTGGWSAAFGSGRDYNMEKMQEYFKIKDAQFEKDPFYQVNKLSLIQKLRKNPKAEALYSELLMSIPNAYLSVPGLYHHLTNKFHQLFEKDANLAFEVAGYFYQTNDFNSFLHEASAQNFLDPYSSYKERWDNALEVVRLMHTDKNLGMRQTADPLFYWSQANKNPKDLNRLLSSANALLKMDIKTMQLGKGGRYGLLVYQLLVNAGKQTEASQLLDVVIGKLHVVVADTLYDGRKDDRSILAHAYQLKYLERKGSGDVNAIKYLSLAAQYSPSGPSDKSIMSGYDRHFLKSKETYRQDFVETLFSSGDEKHALKTFAAHISAEPENLAEMKALYLKHFPQKDFKTLIKDEVIVSWDKAPDFKLKDLENNDRTLKDYSGKWMVLDFWGTWCGPCVAELPEINIFNKELDEGRYPGATFLSIACKDYEQTVKEFLTKNKYDIPVLMSDNKIQFKYKIDGYPYKVMVSPTGRMITLERGKDWREILKLFSSIVGI